MAKTIDTSLLDTAIKFAVDAHKGAERRGKGFPYIIHPMEATEIVSTMTSDQELLAAAMLHDCIEDTPVTYDQIKDEFGKRVADLVRSESDIVVENKTESESWHERKQAAIDRIANSSRDAKIVAMGDKLSNMRAINRDYKEIGDKLWDKFHVTDKSEHKWHYVGLLHSLDELQDTFAYKEFEKLLKEVFD